MRHYPVHDVPSVARRAVLISLFFLSSLLSACSYSRHPADPRRTLHLPDAAIAPDAWPRLVPVGVPTFTESAEQTLRLAGGGATPTLPGELRFTTVTHAEVVADAWVRWAHSDWSTDAKTPPRPTDFEIFLWHPDEHPPEGMVNGCIAGLVADQPTRARRAWLNNAKFLRVGFSVTLPQRRPIRGLILYTASIGPQYEAPVIRELVSRGWAVVSASAASIAADGLFDDRLDFTRHASAAYDAYARVAAREFDHLLAGYAYAWDAARALVEREFPEIPMHPCVMAGFSYGALMTPTAAARLGDHIDAIVLVGGGANLFGIFANTPVFRFELPVIEGPLAPPARPRRFATQDELRRIEPFYLQHARLDPYHTAPLLAEKPLLMLHAAFDGYVPARFGRQLWERAGRPERWVGPFGHALMFYFLDWQSRPIADWIDRTTATVKPATPAP